jgi:hypothetical protein
VACSRENLGLPLPLPLTFKFERFVGKDCQAFPEVLEDLASFIFRPHEVVVELKAEAKNFMFVGKHGAVPL